MEDLQMRYLSSAFKSASAEAGCARMLGDTDIPVRTVFCCECGKKMDGRAYEHPQAKGQYLCDQHYERFASKCGGCNQAIFGQYVSESSIRYHPQCYNNDHSCARCNKPVFGEVISALSKHYHPRCFNCSRCSKVLVSGAFLERNGDPYCAECGNTPTAIRSVPVRTVESSSRDAGVRSSAESMEIYNTIQQGKEKCPGCNQIIGLDCVQHKGRAWHTGCVKCSQCHNSINFQAGFTEKAGATLCLACSQASQAASKGFCPECGKTLAGCAVVILNGQKYHENCVKCFSCHVSLAGKPFTEAQGHTYCSGCARSLQPGPSATKTTVVTGRTGGFVVNPVTGKKRYL
eukprot:TRINITY_DN305_c0_g1_i1.p1 TRINITY_DN305_c0_g1~~TRINITY_DN305_c0_g1_i1.p1  ORF type:complete len:346 (+),score=107.71 TRINITY_DN305_c0_g1_i1:82-1119(+)